MNYDFKKSRTTYQFKVDKQNYFRSIYNSKQVYSYKYHKCMKLSKWMLNFFRIRDQMKFFLRNFNF
jgi:hypothetical protein